jgi:hypothetical protein
MARTQAIAMIPEGQGRTANSIVMVQVTGYSISIKILKQAW